MTSDSLVGSSLSVEGKLKHVTLKTHKIAQQLHSPFTRSLSKRSHNNHPTRPPLTSPVPTKHQQPLKLSRHHHEHERSIKCGSCTACRGTSSCNPSAIESTEKHSSDREQEEEQVDQGRSGDARQQNTVSPIRQASQARQSPTVQE